jgi:hypothetical protein
LACRQLCVCAKFPQVSGGTVTKLHCAHPLPTEVSTLAAIALARSKSSRMAGSTLPCNAHRASLSARRERPRLAFVASRQHRDHWHQGHRARSGSAHNAKLISTRTLVTTTVFAVLIAVTDPVTAATAAETAALVDLYSATNGSGWTIKTGWLAGDPCSSLWNGVGCAGGSVMYVRYSIIISACIASNVHY